MKLLVRIWIYLSTIKAKINIRFNATLAGRNYTLFKDSRVYLSDNSQKCDVKLGDHISMLGMIHSANHGKVEMCDYTKIGYNSKIFSVIGVRIGKYTAIADNVVICDNNNHPVNPLYRLVMRQQPHGSEMRKWKYSVYSPIVIGENVWIGQGVRINKGVTVGDNSVIAACSVVTKDIPANCIVAGNPAKIVKTEIDKIPYPLNCEDFNLFLKDKQ